MTDLDYYEAYYNADIAEARSLMSLHKMLGIYEKELDYIKKWWAGKTGEMPEEEEESEDDF